VVISINTTTKLLELGRVVITPAARDELPEADVFAALGRHRTGDWGEVSKADWEANNASVWNGTRVVSAHLSAEGRRFWIITEADRAYTTILLPEEY
jgi:hypothetical protein